MSMLIPTAVLLLSGACSIRQYVPAPGVASESHYALVKADSLLFAIRPQSYNGANGAVGNRFFPVYLRVKNTGQQKRMIARGSFSIIAQGHQFDAVPVELILANMRQASLLKDYQNPFAVSEDDPIIRDEQRDQDAYYDLISNSFSFGELLPGAIKEGYLFYDNRVDAADSFEMDVLGKSIGFVEARD